jgi:hypothetical protein
LSKAYYRTVTVSYATADGTAASPGDYAAASGKLTFAPGERSKAVEVTVTGDIEVEADETFALSDPVGATLTDDSATGTIQNQDKPCRARPSCAARRPSTSIRRPCGDIRLRPRMEEVT